MGMLPTIRSWFSIPVDNEELVLSKARALSRQVPLLYFILIVNTAALAATHIGTAPTLLAAAIPSLLICISCIRLFKWWKLRGQPLSTVKALAMLRSTRLLSAILGIGFSAWAFSLYPYGGPYAQSFVPFYIATTSICVIICLMHLRSAAIVAACTVVPAFAVFFGSSGNVVFFAMSINLALVTIGLLFMVQRNHEDFARLIETQKALIAKQRETQQLVDENVRLASKDSLTGLPNRRSFFTALEEETQAAQPRRSFAIAVLDLDGFKPVNDLYGHSIGDRVLVEAGRRLDALSSDEVMIARIGGDEFGVLVRGEKSAEAILAFGEKICSALNVPFTISDISFQLSGTAGFALSHDCAESAETLVEHADCALFHAKQNMRGRPILFSREHETQFRRHGLIEQALRKADFEREISLVFQPIYDVRAGGPVGFESLARWISPTLGVVPPDLFISIAERAGVISQLSEHLLRRSLKEAESWPDDQYIAFNLSACDIASTEAVSRICQIIKGSKISASRIELEITETAVMHDFGRACDALRRFRALGVRIALDDFGTGYSSLSYVHKLPLDKIKVDRSFIAEIETSPVSRNIVRTVIDLCRNMKLDCTVEGAETASQITAITSMGVWLFQGYFFARPMPASEVPAYIEQVRTPDKASA